MRVLVAETDSAVAKEIQATFEDDGCEAASVASSLRVWDRLDEEPTIDLLITRIMFGIGQVPGTALGARAQSMGIPVIYIPSSAERAVHAVVDHGAVLVKPLDMQVLAATARTVLAQRGARLEAAG